MSYKLLVLAISGLFGTVFSQSPLLVSFETGEESLIRFLGSHPGVAFVTLPTRQVKATCDSTCFEYNYSSGGKLFQIVMFRNFADKKKAENYMQDLVTHYRNLKATTFDESAGKNNRKVVAIKDGVIVDMIHLPAGDGSYQVKLVKRNPMLDPMEPDHEYSPSASFSLLIPEKP